MTRQAIYRIALLGSAFGDDVACLGPQLAEVLRTLYPDGTSLRWYYSDVQTNNRSSFSEERGVHEVGELDELVRAVRTVDQFQAGVFLGSAASAPRFREDPRSDDREFSDLGDAELEIRAFDTTYFEVYATDKSRLCRLSERYNCDVEMSFGQVE